MLLVSLSAHRGTWWAESAFFFFIFLQPQAADILGLTGTRQL